MSYPMTTAQYAAHVETLTDMETFDVIEKIEDLREKYSDPENEAHDPSIAQAQAIR